MLKRFNLFDYCIIFLIILISAVSYFVLQQDPGKELREAGKQETFETVNISYTLLFEGKEKHIADNLTDSYEIFFYATDNIAGKVVSKYVQPHTTEFLVEEKDEIIKIEQPEKYDIFITMEALAEKKRDGVYVIGDMEISKTKMIELKGKYFLLSGIVYSVEEK